MREFVRICLVSICVLVLASFEGSCQDADLAGSREETVDLGGKVEEQNESRKDGKASFVPGGVRRPSAQSSSSSGDAARDSQLLSLLAARRRQLLTGRLATHISALASIANSTKGNTTFAQLEIRDSNSSIVKKITFDNSTNSISPSLRLTTANGTKEIHQDIKPHEIRHLFVPKIYQENKSRAGFINNRKKGSTTATLPEQVTETFIVYVPPDKFEGVDKEIDLDPEEEFQVDESNHGLYLLNYSDVDNVTQTSETNTTIGEIKTTPLSLNITLKSFNVIELNDSKIELKSNSTGEDIKSLKSSKFETEKDKVNNTLFMSDEIYNHFRPLETELPVEDMAPFIYFGQKIGGQAISDNLTYSPVLSASTKSVNFVASPSEKRRYNSRYSATEKYKNTSANEEEVNEDMDVSVDKNVIEKNKIRNTVKGPAPARHVGVVNAYRRSTSAVPTVKPPNIAQLNVTESIIQNVSPNTLDKLKDANKSSTSKTKEITSKGNTTITSISKNSTSAVTPSNSLTTNKTVTTAVPKNFTRNYHNLRRRPSRLTSSPSTENNFWPLLNTTTEKSSTSVYTAVVTSVSITSSVRGQNKTELKENESNNTIPIYNENKTSVNTTQPIVVFNANNTIENTTVHSSSSVSTLQSTIPSTTAASSSKSYGRHRIRIRTSTENPMTSSAIPLFVPIQRPTELPTVDELSTKNADLKHEATSSAVSEKFSSLFNQIPGNVSSSTLRPKKRRRPTTTTSSTTTSNDSPSFIPTVRSSYSSSFAPVTYISKSTFPTETPRRIENTKPTGITPKSSPGSNSNPSFKSVNSAASNATISNTTDLSKSMEDSSTNEEVVIEAEKTYTASYVLAGLGFLPVAAIVIFVLRNIMNRKTKEVDMEYEGYFDDGDLKKESPITPVARPPMPTPTKPDQKWEFPRNKLRLQTLLGQGNFGQVWKAEADDLNGHDGLTRLVAVKTIKESASQKEKQELLHEILIMQKIGPHPNVVTILACCTEQEPYLLIMEYVMCGKLLTYLRERRSRPDRFSGSGALTSRDLTVFAYCVARGMDYIASKGIVHRDLAARNILVDHNKLCKVADFGMSVVAGGAARGRHALPVRWMAPEALLYSRYTTQTDVWAFGILLWEIVTLGSTPYASMSGREVLSAVTEGYRLERPPHCKPQLYQAMSACWHADPSQRPTFADLKAQLADLLDNEPSEGNYVDLDSFYQESSVYSDPSAIIHDDEGLSAEYDRERRCFRELQTGGSGVHTNRAFNFREEEARNKFSATQRMGGFGIRDGPFNDRTFSDGEFTFTDNFTDRKDTKLSTSSFHRERERENPLISRNSFSGFPRIGRDGTHFMPDGRNKRVPEFECDI